MNLIQCLDGVQLGLKGSPQNRPSIVISLYCNIKLLNFVISVAILPEFRRN